MICEFCKKENDGSYGTGRFCNHLCQCKWARLIATRKSSALCKEKAKNKREIELNTKFVIFGND